MKELPRSRIDNRGESGVTVNVTWVRFLSLSCAGLLLAVSPLSAQLQEPEPPMDKFNIAGIGLGMSNQVVDSVVSHTSWKFDPPVDSAYRSRSVAILICEDSVYGTTCLGGEGANYKEVVCPHFEMAKINRRSGLVYQVSYWSGSIDRKDIKHLNDFLIAVVGEVSDKIGSPTHITMAPGTITLADLTHVPPYRVGHLNDALSSYITEVVSWRWKDTNTGNASDYMAYILLYRSGDDVLVELSLHDINWED